MNRQNQYLYNRSSTKMGFSLTSHACKQMLSFIEETVKIGKEGETLKMWFNHKHKPFNIEFIQTLF